MKKEVLKSEVDEVFAKTLEFLVTFGHLLDERPPSFEEQYTEQGFTHPIVYGQPWKRHDPFFHVPPKRGDRVRECYESVQSMLETISSRELELKVLRDIPDSSEYALIDIGSGLGNRFTNEFAKSHPHVAVVMIDHVSPSWLEQEIAYIDVNGEHGVLNGFKKKVTLTGNPEHDLNELLQANNLRNVTYIHRKITASRENQLANIKEIGGKNLTVTGFRNPQGLGYLTLQQIQLIEAQQGVVTMSALEKIERDDPSFQTAASRLAHHLPAAAIEKYYCLLTDNYKDVDKGPFGLMLKQLFVTTHAILMPERFGPDLMYTPPINGRYNYNQPSHAVWIVRQ